MAQGPESITKPAIERSLAIVLMVLAFFILYIEFFYDLKKEPLLSRVVVGFDIALLLIYCAIVVRKIITSPWRLIDMVRRYKVDTVLIVFLLLFLMLPRLAAALVIIRLLMAWLLSGLESKWGTKFLAHLNLRPSQSLALGFLGLIAFGTVLLTFPAATVDGRGASLVNAIFTMTSASCVSGLMVYNIGFDFTRFGQVVILFAMQAGGLGIMVLSASFAVLVGGNITARRQVGLREVLDISTPEGLKSLIKAVTATTIFMEFAGALALFFLWHDDIPQISERLWWSVFHAVSAFCNCGISLSGTFLFSFVNDTGVSLVFMVLITVGGIGFFVILDLLDPEVWRIKKPRAIWARLEIQTRVVIIATLLLNSLGMLLFLFFEYDGALHGLSIKSKLLASLFHAISLRTAGFAMVPLANIAAPTIIFSLAFMFIGASPGSTGGGIKTTTAAISFMALRAMLRGRDEVEIMGRRMPALIVSRSLSIVLVAVMIVTVFLTLLSATQEIKFENLLFETVSAFGTVGLSMDTTQLLNNQGKLLIAFLMYVGRIGPLTLALAIGEKKLLKAYRLPKGRIAVG